MQKCNSMLGPWRPPATQAEAHDTRPHGSGGYQLTKLLWYACADCTKTSYSVTGFTAETNSTFK